MPDVPPLKKRIPAKILREIRQTLERRRAALVGSLSHIDNQVRAEHSAQSGGDVVDQATFSATADLSLRMAENDWKALRDIDLALRKLDDGTYGICEVTGKPIGIERLRALPAVRLSKEAQERFENNLIYHDNEGRWHEI